MTIDATKWGRLPKGMKQRNQWAVAGASKAPMSVDPKGKLYNVSVNQPSQWMSFEQACAVAWHFRELVTTHIDNRGRTVTQTGLNIGYILNADDPFTCIDLDVKDAMSHPGEPELWTKPEQFDFYWNIVLQLGTYTERSRSGKGLHAWAEGKIGVGFKRDGVEIYSQERFIISTGDIVQDLPVANRQMMLTNMVSQMRPVKATIELEELEEFEDDWSILLKATSASNSDKFGSLRAGDWVGLGFPSQSEADLAFLSMLTFYSPSNAQCRRLFRESALGQREKAIKNDVYINRTLKIIRERQAREERVDISAIIASAELVQQLAQASAQSRSVISLHTPEQQQIAPAPAPAEVTAASLAPVSAEVVAAGEVGIAWPPGFVGDVARYIYQNSIRPVKEVAIVAAIGLMSGLVGKAWHIPQSGLNLYVTLIAQSGVGKESMHSGISSIVRACAKDNPLFFKFVDFTEYASGPALIKACVANPCFVNVSGEWGKRLRQMSDDHHSGPLQTLRTQMTNLYQKSGPAAIVGGIGYSSTDNNVASVGGVSYSLIGETTPGTFYESLTESMMEDGFMSRFLIIEYTGDRPVENEHRLEYPDAAMVRALNNLATQADMMIAKGMSQLIGRTEEAATLMARFNKLCDKNINANKDESRRQMWNRAALKSLRLAGTFAVGDNPVTPCITQAHIEYAQDVVMRDIAIMSKRLESGDVGTGDNSRERKLVSVLKEYLTKPVSASYKVPDSMRENSIVPRNYLQIRTNSASSFTGHRNGKNRALEESIQSLVSDGYLMEVAKDKVVDAYGFHGKAYRILKLPDYD
jgi:hypothetical protein